MIKADGTTESRHFGQTNHVSRLKHIADELDWLSEQRGGSGAAEDLRNYAARVSCILRELLSDHALESPERRGPDDVDGVPAESQNAKSWESSGAFKIGARNSAADQERVQRMHDMSIELGAACDTKKSVRGGLEKRFDMLAEALAAILERLKKIEDQPLPLPFIGPARAMSKAEESGIEECDAGQHEKLLENPERLSVLAIKLAQRRGRSALR